MDRLNFLKIIPLLMTCVLVAANPLNSQVTSTTGNLNFDINGDSQAEMVLNANGLGIGTSQISANLHMAGHAMITQNLSIGTSNTSSNLFLSGTQSMSLQSLSTNATLNRVIQNLKRFMDANSTTTEIQRNSLIASTLPSTPSMPNWLKNSLSNSTLVVAERRSEKI